MSKRDGRRVVLADYKERKADEGAIDVVLPDGTVFRIPPPELWPDGAMRKIQAANRPGAEAYDIEEQARDICGAAEFELFVAQGGSAVLIQALIKDHHGTSTGESPAS